MLHLSSERSGCILTVDSAWTYQMLIPSHNCTRCHYPEDLDLEDEESLDDIF